MSMRILKFVYNLYVQETGAKILVVKNNKTEILEETSQ